MKEQNEVYEVTITPSGTKTWRQNGYYHRLDGPAVECTDGSYDWYFEGDLHRTDGPAQRTHLGSEHWYLNGKRHRTDGPAIVYREGHEKRWYIEGVELSESEFNRTVKRLKSLEECSKRVTIDGVEYELVEVKGE